MRKKKQVLIITDFLLTSYLHLRMEAPFMKHIISAYNFFVFNQRLRKPTPEPLVQGCRDCHR